MLSNISLLTSLSVGFLYPCSFFIHAKTPLKNYFHRFHLALPLILGGSVVTFFLLGPTALEAKILFALWFLSLGFVTCLYWKKEVLPAQSILPPAFFGLLSYLQLQLKLFPGASFSLLFTGVLAGLILCATLHNMMLGHWYLNVQGLPLHYLKRAHSVLWALLGLRLIWDLYFLFQGSLLYGGDRISLMTFSTTLDGFLLWIGIFFGTLFPFIILYFVKEILKVKNTQSATGVLYVILCSVLMGELSYKYYLVKFGVVL